MSHVRSPWFRKQFVILSSIFRSIISHNFLRDSKLGKKILFARVPTAADYLLGSKLISK